MRVRNAFAALVMATLGAVAYAQTPPAEQLPRAQPPVRPAEPSRPPTTTAPPGATQPPQVQNAPAPQDSGQAPVLSSAPRMIGDFPGYLACSNVIVNSTITSIVPSRRIIIGADGRVQQQLVILTPVQSPATEEFKFCTVALSRGSFKIAENESPQPQDRAFITYNEFHNVAVRANGSATTIGQPGNTAQLGTNLTDATVFPMDIHRETVGFEKSFFDGNTSVGFRLPVLQTSQSSPTTSVNNAAVTGLSQFPTTLQVNSVEPGFDGARVGDLTIVLKHALFNDVDGGRAFSTGLAITAPTGGGIPLDDGSRLYSTILQPYLGALQSWDRLFVHGFSSIAVPTDRRDVKIWFNDMGIGYFVYRDSDGGWLNSIAPTFETHVSSPLTNGKNGIDSVDSVVLTGGLHFGLGQRSVLTLGVATPVTGPRPYEIESQVQFNWLF
ncbi:MAG: hypothetical protein ACJ8C4_20075 [Gemmataceae bacterium]